MKKLSIMLLPMLLGLCACGSTSGTSSPEGIKITDMINREITVTPGSYRRVVCIGAGALRLYTYIGDVSLLSGVEDIDNLSLTDRPKMFDGVARPYMLANQETFKTLPSCGVGGPNAQTADAEKILACNPDIVISEYEDVEKEDALQKKLGVPVVTMKFSGSDTNLYNSLSLLGKIFAKEERANDVINFHKEQLKQISDKTKDVADADKKGVYICGLGNWGTTNQYWTAQNYPAFNVAHVKNVVSGLPNDGIQQIKAEEFVSLAEKMEVMIFDAAAVKNIKNKEYDFSLCKAFETGEVYLQMAYNAYYTNVETALINNWFIAKSVYPSLFTDLDIEAKANEITQKFNGVALYDKIKAMPQSFGGYQKIANPTEFFK